MFGGEIIQSQSQNIPINKKIRNYLEMPLFNKFYLWNTSRTSKK